MVRVVIHSNPHLSNQIESAGWLKQGFQAHGLDVTVTADKHAAGDIHVVQGPHYAYREWLGKPNVIWLNRCFYGDSRYDLSIGWLNADGSRDFRNTGKTDPNGVLPELQPEKDGNACVIFADYGKQTQALHWEIDARLAHRPVYVRNHPADTCVYFYTLDEMWARCSYAIGGESTVLVDAAINGLHVTSHDPTHVIQDMTNREEWITRLSWAQWSHEQIQRGEFWEHLK